MIFLSFSDQSIFLFFQQIDIPGLMSLQQDYYPYVYFKMDLNYIDASKK